MSGGLVRTLVDAPAQAGQPAATWDRMDDAGRLAGAGAYVVALSADGRSASRKLMVLR